MNGVITGIIVDVFQALFKTIPWKKVYDQYLYRLIAKALRALAARSSNKVDDEVVEAVLQLLDISEVPVVDTDRKV